MGFQNIKKLDSEELMLKAFKFSCLHSSAAARSVAKSEIL